MESTVFNPAEHHGKWEGEGGSTQKNYKWTLNVEPSGEYVMLKFSEEGEQVYKFWGCIVSKGTSEQFMVSGESDKLPKGFKVELPTLIKMTGEG